MVWHRPMVGHVGVGISPPVLFAAEQIGYLGGGERTYGGVFYYMYGISGGFWMIRVFSEGRWVVLVEEWGLTGSTVWDQ